MSFSVDQLHPYIAYEVTVINRVIESPYFSDPATSHVTTLMKGNMVAPHKLQNILTVEEKFL